MIDQVLMTLEGHACQFGGGGLLGVRLELVAKLPLLELLSEALVVAPEEADVRDVKEHHSQTLQPKPAAPQPAVTGLFTFMHST